MGALTSKPFAFRARPWETKSIEFFDIFSSFFQLLRYDIRGYTIFRIIPDESALITDQARFFFDSILLESRSSISNGSSLNKPVEETMGLGDFRSLCLKHFTIYRIFAGRFLDIFDSNAINEFSAVVGNAFMIGDHYDISFDLPSDLFDSTLPSSLSFQSILLMCADIRLEAPLIAHEIHDHPNIYSVGDFSLLFSRETITSSNDQFNIDFITGKHPMWKFLLQYSSCLIIVGSRYSQLKEKVLNLSNSIVQFLQQFSKISFEGIYGNISLLPSLTALNFNCLIPKFCFKAFKTTLLIGAEAVTLLQKYSAFYFGSYYDNGARSSTNKWPSLTLMERKVSRSLFSNGIYYNNFQVLPSDTKARHSRSILGLLRLVLGSNTQPKVSRKSVLSNAHTQDNFFFLTKFFLVLSSIVFYIAFWNSFQATIFHRNSLNISVAGNRFSQTRGNFYVYFKKFKKI